MADPNAQGATRLIRFAAWASGFAVVVWYALAWISSEVRVVRMQSPWSEDPPDLFISLAVLIVGFVGLLTFIRVQRHTRMPVMPAATADDVLRGLIVALGGTAVAEMAQVAAIAGGAQRFAWGPITTWLGLGLVAAILTLIVAVVLTAIAAARTVAWRREAAAEARDAFDDIIGWVVELGDSPIPRRLGARHLRPAAQWLADGLDTWRFSPRRHRWLFALAVAAAFGLAFSAAHVIGEGLPPNVDDAFLVLGVFGAFGAAAVLFGWIAFGSYLRLVRHG